MKLTEKIEEVIGRIRWKVYHSLSGNQGNTIDNYGFNSLRTLPKNKILENFENELIEVINKLEFRSEIGMFQKEMIKEVKSFKKFKDLLIKADKTNNIYKLKTDEYARILHRNITRNYKKVRNGNQEYSINIEAKEIAEKLKISDRVPILQKKNAYILLKDHKENFANDLNKYQHIRKFQQNK